jgi:ribonuclease-3
VASSPAGLAPRLGHAFGDERLLEQALTHSSYVNEHPDPPLVANERLEFLGDAVLSLVISEALWERHPHDPEGVLTARRAAIVSARDLARIAGRIDLGDYLLLGQGAERSGERSRGSVVAAAFEAVIAAVYLDGGIEAARRVVLALCGPELDRPLAPVALKSPKSRLQELAYRRDGRPPSYRVLAIEGPAHERRYEVEVALGGVVVGRGVGRSRRDAETEAASVALDGLVAPPDAAARGVESGIAGSIGGPGVILAPTDGQPGPDGR